MVTLKKSTQKEVQKEVVSPSTEVSKKQPVTDAIEQPKKKK